MKKKKNVFSMGFLGKFVLLVALFVGGGMSAWAGDVFILTFENNNPPSGWTLANYAFDNNYLKADKTWNTMTLTSESTFSIENGQKIVITAKGLNTSLAKIGISFSTSETNATFSSSSNKDFTTEIRKDTNNDYELTYENTSNRTCFLKFSGYYAAIKKIEILSALSELTVIDEGTDPGEFKSNTPSSLTVKYTANAGWNTIYMPFNLRTYSVNHMPEIFGTDWKAYRLENYNNGILTFSQVASSGYLNANTPLLVYAPNATGSQTELNLTNEAVIYSASPSTTVNGATFQGTYAPMSMEGKYGVTSSGQVMQGTATADIKGYRAYFTGITPPAGGARPTIVFEDDKEAQGLSAVMWMENTKEAYNLQGQKVEKGRKGIYIVNGRKVIIK